MDYLFDYLNTKYMWYMGYIINPLARWGVRVGQMLQMLHVTINVTLTNINVNANVTFNVNKVTKLH